MLDIFEERMLDIWRRGAFRVPEPERIARRVRTLLSTEGFGLASRVLVESGVRAEWNRVFAEERSEFVGAWLAPYATGAVLDVLGGDFTVLRALLRHKRDGGAVTGCERATAYDNDWSQLPFPVYDVPADLRLPAGEYDSVLICTVLHHEPDVRSLLDAVARTGARRWVVVENCLDADNDEDFHLYVDQFFNRCLNTFDVPCVTQHRTAAQWCELLAEYGTVTVEEHRRGVPGMPFPYTLFLVEQ
jgi:hypothetical protein